jgi:soluble lytic murein transglycosylase-like protein
MKRILNTCFWVVTLVTICACWFILGARCERYKHQPTVETEIVTTVMPEETNPPVEPIEQVYYDCPLDNDLQDYIREVCEINDIPMSLVLAIISAESSFRQNIISKTNDYGLMQINVVNHEWLSEEFGITDFLDPYSNVFCGIQIYMKHYEKYGNMNKALMAYNLGATGAKRLWDKGIYGTDYTQKILKIMEEYDNEIQQSSW